jgi:uncharacterized RDD family membrane protein YckC
MEQILDQVDSKTDYIYGGFWVRVVAAFIDWIIVSTGQSLVTYLFINKEIYPTIWGAGMLSSGMIIGLIYHVYFLSSDKQATIGKQAMGLKVINLHGDRITPINAVGRFFATYLSMFLLGFGYLMVAFDSKKQAMHDKLAGTYVVKIRNLNII